MSHSLRFPRIALLFMLAALLSLAACTKQEVKDDDAFITPSGQGAAGDTAAQAPPTQGAGDVGQPAADLQIVYFPFDSSVLTADAQEALKANASYLKDNAAVTVQIEGHCDERGTVEYNLALGERRAAAAKNYLKKLGIEEKRISTISYGKERPADPGHDETAWAKNRRAVFVVNAPKEAQTAPQPDSQAGDAAKAAQ